MKSVLKTCVLRAYLNAVDLEFVCSRLPPVSRESPFPSPLPTSLSPFQSAKLSPREPELGLCSGWGGKEESNDNFIPVMEADLEPRAKARESFS